MPFPFVYVCDILDRLERPHLRDVPPLPTQHKSSTREMTIEWFKLHRHQLNHFNTSSEAVLSMLQPETLADRTYGLDTIRMEFIIGRVLRLPREHFSDLQTCRTEVGRGDLGACVKRVMETYKTLTFRSQTNSVTVEEIDQILLRIAAFNPGSSDAVRSLAKSWARPDEVALLGPLFNKLQGREAKWLTRFILKDYGPVTLPKDLALGSGHSTLPNCLQVSVQLLLPTSSAVRQDGTGLIRDVSDSAIQPKPMIASSTAAPVVLTVMFPPIPPVSSSPRAPSTSSITVLQHKPLEATTPNLNIHKSVHTSPTRVRSALAPLSSHSQNSQRTSSQINHKPVGSNHQIPITKAANSRCQLAEKSCVFSHCIFILSPCISASSHTSHQLLSWHGARYITALPQLKSSLPRRCSQTGKRLRKVVLVESRHAGPTVEFLRKMMRLRSRADGEWGKVEVYDWRLLESISKSETGRQLTHDPWKRLWMLDI